ncbi:MAG: hypothetical protein Q8M88_09480 [Phenylobacterium sp.]|uniref:hypothetical protein n=1 Tax=Phenylobacterium sp. TaxID=1871053 RepID=UPI0027326B16|nr:hypothetical protein [Phenylobacterium sp.]MDP3174650.1 hypothetical protein [Phenylobacterium sp.]
MILKRALSTLAAASAIAAAAGVAVIAAAFALYALLATYLVPAGAAAIVAALAALLALLGALLMLHKPAPSPLKESDGLSARAIDFARARPVIAIGAALAVGLVAFRNPKLVTAAVTAFLAGKSAPKS